MSRKRIRPLIGSIAGVPRMRTLAAGLALLICFGAAFYALTPTLSWPAMSVVTPEKSSPRARTFDVGPVAAGHPQALYIPSAGGVTALRIGEQEVAPLRGASGFGSNSDSIVLPLPPPTPAGTTIVTLRLGDDNGRIGISRVFAAPRAAVEEAAAAQREWARRNQFETMIIAVVASFLLVILIGGVSPHFRPGALGALSYIVLGQALARERAVGAFFGPLIDGAEYWLAIWAVYALAVVLKENSDVARLGRTPFVLLCLSTAAALITLIDVTPLYTWPAAIVAAPLIGIGAVRAWQATNDPTFSPLNFAVLTLALLAAAFGLLRAADPRIFNGVFELATLHSLGAIPLLILGAITVVYHWFTARRQTLAKLQAEYAAQSAELGGVRASLEEESRKRMLFEERGRITRDMHDGIGGRLMSLLIRVRAGRLDISDVEREVQESLDDLRLIVDSLDSAGDTLSEALDAFRTRAERQVTGAGLTLSWREETGALNGVTLDPHATLSVLRILQEATANAIRHAGANTVSFSFARDETGKLAVAVGDDGRGLAPDSGSGRGKGLKNMRARAEQLGAAFALASNGGTGCRVSFALPLDRAS